MSSLADLAIPENSQNCLSNPRSKGRGLLHSECGSCGKVAIRADSIDKNVLVPYNTHCMIIGRSSAPC